MPSPRTRGPRRTGQVVPCLVALSYAGGGFFLIFGGTLGLHLVGDEYTVTAKLALDHGLCPVDERIWRGIGADVLYEESFDVLRLLVLLADYEVNDLAVMLDRARHHVSSDLQPACVRLILGCIEFGNRLVIRVTFLKPRVGQVSQRENDHDRAKHKLKLFAFHGFTPSESTRHYSTSFAGILSSKRDSHKKAQKAQKMEMNFVTFVPFCGRSFPVLRLERKPVVHWLGEALSDVRSA